MVKNAVFSILELRSGCMGGVQNLPHSQTVRVDPQDSILKGYVVWVGPHHFTYY